MNEKIVSLQSKDRVSEVVELIRSMQYGKIIVSIEAGQPTHAEVRTSHRLTGDGPRT